MLSPEEGNCMSVFKGSTVLVLRRAPLFAALLLPSVATAGQDEFRLSNGDHQVHMAAGFGLSLSGSLILMKKDVPKAESVLISGLTAIGILTLKELVVDRSYSGGDQLANSIGVSAQVFVVGGFLEF